MPESLDRPGEEPQTQISTIFDFACPGGATRNTNPGVCVGTLGGSDESLSEPNIAGDPTRPRTWALGVNSASLRPRDMAAAPVLSSPGVATGLYVTRDDGATWTARGLPLVPGYVHSGDPSLVFDGQGRLHFTGLILSPQANRAVFYARSSDLGATWDSVWFQNDGENPDRNWVGLGPNDHVFITWQKGGGGPAAFVQVAWSQDAGKTWTDLGASGRIPSCNLQTPVVVGMLGPVFACVKREADTYFTHVYRLDAPNKTTQRLGLLRSPSGTLHLDALVDGSLVLTLPAGSDTLVARSLDGGGTWSAPLGVRALAVNDDSWTWVWPTWTAADAHGALHLLLAGGTGANCYRATCADAPTSRQVAYVSIDPGAARLLAEALLTPANVAERPRSEPRPLSPLGDEFHGIAFGPGGGMIAWGHHQSIDFTRLVARDL